MDPFIGEIRMFAGNFAPENWAFCNGQPLPVSQQELLFSVLGVQYGGDGVTFNLPDLRGRVPVGSGTREGLTRRVPGQLGGSETVALTLASLPVHSHAFNASKASADSSSLAQSAVFGTLAAGSGVYLDITTSGATEQTLAPGTIGFAGGGSSIGAAAPHNNMMSTTVVSFIIALIGQLPVPR